MIEQLLSYPRDQREQLELVQFFICGHGMIAKSICRVQLEEVAISRPLYVNIENASLYTQTSSIGN